MLGKETIKVKNGSVLRSRLLPLILEISMHRYAGGKIGRRPERALRHQDIMRSFSG